MLAERKQKQRWSLNPRGKHWSEGYLIFHINKLNIKYASHKQ